VWTINENINIVTTLLCTFYMKIYRVHLIVNFEEGLFAFINVHIPIVIGEKHFS
jgi:hypothetical protein